MKTIGIPTAAILAVILGVMGIAAYGYIGFQKDVAAMRAASLEDITWTSSQLELELSRFREELTQFQIGDYGTDADDVNKRFDILWSRIALFQQGRVGERLAEYDKDIQGVTGLFEHMKLVDRRIVELKNGDTAEAAMLLAEFVPFSEKLREFSRQVTLGEEIRGRKIRDQLQKGVNRTLLYGFGAILAALVSLVLVNRESLKFKRLAVVNLDLADEATKASRAKSRFLTMMSHELRTPMNGVLGLLALSKQSATQPAQVRLIEQAETSGHKMMELLSDVMDFSVLQSETLVLDKKPFDISHLGLAVRNRFEPLARREGITFDVSVANDCSKRFLGDFRRVRQAFTHLAQYIVETAGTQDIAMDFSCFEGALVMRLSFDYISSGVEWTPNLILGNDNRAGEKFSTDALGPAIARGYIDAMGGAIRVDNPVGDRIAVVATIPIEEFTASSLNVTVLANSEAMIAICRAALQNENVVFVQSDENKDVHIVLIESGNASESAFIAQAAMKHPNALLVALGNPVQAEVFDFSIELPLDFKKLREIVYQKIA